MSRDKQNIKTTDWLTRGMTEAELAKEKEEAIKEAEAELREKQTEIHELAKQMSEAISTEVEQRYIEDEAKLEAVLRANGWVKAEEIFAEIDEIMSKLDRRYMASGNPKQSWGIRGAMTQLAELKKKYIQSEDK